MKKRLLSLTLVSTIGAGAALADVDATAVTDLNLRAGPSPAQPVIDVIPNAGAVSIQGCIEASSWCEVSYNGTQGWAYGDYLAASTDAGSVRVIENRSAMNLPTVTYEYSEADTVDAGGTITPLADSYVGPIDPVQSEVVYVRDNPMDPYYLDGEVVTGATLPEVVDLRTVPDSEYRYAYVNGVPVLVEPAERRVVYIVR
ncbi:MAG: DUF1236 domain-containing protein [Roseovarius confluentis]|jgi:uncharacterized protein YraI|uniref:DUF1236 domain-containing protein n=1 Tax=Roseovarius confluentis TaxID=1852027 RepID=UPI000CDD5C33|nr:DUF1236 domain-containing protein [Roseovarius confluentis]